MSEFGPTVASDTLPALPALRARASALLDGTQGERAFETLRPVLEQEVAEPLERLAEAPDPPTEVLERKLRTLSGQLRVFEILAAERRDRAAGERLAVVERLLRDLWEPWRAHSHAQGWSLRGRVVAASTTQDLPAVYPDSDLVVFTLGAQFGAHPYHWDGLVQRMALQAWQRIAGMGESFHDRLGLPRAMPAPTTRESYDANRVVACFGVWLPAFFSEAVATMQLGAGHLSALSARFGRGHAVTRAALAGGQVSSDPPAHLRMRAALTTARELGLVKEAAAYEAAWHQQHGDAGALATSHLPLRDGSVLSLETAYLEARSDELLDFMLHEGVPALDGFPLPDIPDLALGPHELRVQDDLFNLVISDPSRQSRKPVDGEPRIVLGAALRALGHEAAGALSPAAVESAIQHGLGRIDDDWWVRTGASPAEGSNGRTTRTRRDRGRGIATISVRSALRVGLRSRRAWAEAVTLRAAFGRRQR